ncbi:DUF397 domain-containing protein [Streptomyces sp. NPDC005576]|uniref:DUF397 domain-containing protein n=1 Tax=unclassified Streptomyces TaxID=2593676 RepID=UPI0033F97DB5
MSIKPTGGEAWVWFKSSYSSSDANSDCIEVAAAASAVLVRDSKNVRGPQLGFRSATWTAFVGFAAEN